MNKLPRTMAVVAFALLVSLPVLAQTPEVSTFPVNEPTLVGDVVLQPGTYAIKVVRSFQDRNKIQVTSMDGKTLYATVLTIPHPLEPNEEVPNAMYVFYPSANGEPRALRTWFAQFPEASQGGHDILYEQSRAKQLARRANSNVIAYPDTVEVTTIETMPELAVVTPQETVETYTYTPPAPVVVAETRTTTVETPMVSSSTETQDSQPVDMPATASRLPLIALAGLAALAGAAALRFLR